VFLREIWWNSTCLSSTCYWELFHEYYRRNVRLLLRHGSWGLHSSMMLHSLGCSQLWMFWDKQMVPPSMVKQSMMLFWTACTLKEEPLYFTYINLILMAKTCVPLRSTRNLSYPTTSSIYVLQVMTPGNIKATVHTQQLLPDFITHNCNTYVYWTVHHCDSWRIRDQLDVTSY